MRVCSAFSSLFYGHHHHHEPLLLTLLGRIYHLGSCCCLGCDLLCSAPVCTRFTPGDETFGSNYVGFMTTAAASRIFLAKRERNGKVVIRESIDPFRVSRHVIRCQRRTFNRSSSTWLVTYIVLKIKGFEAQHQSSPKRPPKRQLNKSMLLHFSGNCRFSASH